MNNNACKLYVGQLLTNICDKMLLVGLIWFVTTSYGKHQLTTFLVVALLPHLFITFISARVINRLGELRVIIGSDLFRGILFLIMAVCVEMMKNRVDLWCLIASIFLANTAAAFFNPAVLTIPTKLVPSSSLQRLTALLNSTSSLAGILGPVLAIFFYKVAGLYLLFLISGACYCLATIVEMRIKMYSGQVSVSLRQINYKSFDKPSCNDPLIILMLGLFFAMNLFLGPIQLFMPLYAKTIFLGNLTSLSYMEMGLGCGALLGTFFMSAVSLRCPLWIRIIIPYLLMSLAYYLFAGSHSLNIACFFLVLLGFFLAIGNVSTLNLFQTYPASGAIPAVMAKVNFISVAAMPIAIFVAGNLLTTKTLQLQVQCYALLTFAIALLIFFVPNIYRVQIKEPVAYG